VVRLQVGADIPRHILNLLLENLDLGPQDVYRIRGPLDLSRLRELHALPRPDLKYKLLSQYTPQELLPNSKENLFALIRHQPILLHHPFESFQPVVDFIHRAALDPDVLAIKMTLYRVGRNSPIVKALLDAIQEGKQVSVLLELKARFDEESNIDWARALEREGVHVVYGLVGLKVHSKVALVVRREGEAIRRYVHLGTGNYNPGTAKLYTDLSYFTADEAVGADATELFNHLTGYSSRHSFRKLLVAPVNMRERMGEMIRREIDHARAGRDARLIFKMNALEDPGMIKLLYQASQAGVRVDLLVRGICCLRPGIDGVSDNIRVTSIIGRFLEHSRIYYFGNGGHDEIYLGSADLMPRNLNRRIEVLYPVTCKGLVRRLRHEILDGYLEDKVSARLLRDDGGYQWSPRPQADAGQDSQGRFMALHNVSPAKMPHDLCQ
jgi:polyphosphate kinase